MNTPVEDIIRHLFQTNTTDDVSVQQIQQLINEHPYYGAAYFLMAKKLQLSSQQDYIAATQKAALHVENELWLHYNLNAEIFVQEPINQNTITGKENTDTITDTDGEFIEEEIAEQTSLLTNITGDEDVSEEEDIIDENYRQADFAVNEKLSNLLQQQAADFEKPVEPASEITVENTPYHRVDYFDSQGIKLEEKPDDKLGTQLRRFTDWLKQMKSINPNPNNISNDAAGEAQVQHIAQHSNEQKEIVTETMAEVLVKQSKPEQAIQIYEKLSFQNPSKTAYFAAKIAELKG